MTRFVRSCGQQFVNFRVGDDSPLSSIQLMSVLMLYELARRITVMTLWMRELDRCEKGREVVSIMSTRLSTPSTPCSVFRSCFMFLLLDAISVRQNWLFLRSYTARRISIIISAPSCRLASARVLLNRRSARLVRRRTSRQIASKQGA